MLRRGMAAASVLLVLGACSHANRGWKRDQSRACPDADQMRVCVSASPDRGVVFHVGDASLVPGECASLDEAPKRARVAVRIVDERASVRQERLRTRAGQPTQLYLVPEGLERERMSCSKGELLSP